MAEDVVTGANQSQRQNIQMDSEIEADATTLTERKKYIETDAALNRRFAQVTISEPSVLDIIIIIIAWNSRKM